MEEEEEAGRGVGENEEEEEEEEGGEKIFHPSASQRQSSSHTEHGVCQTDTTDDR